MDIRKLSIMLGIVTLQFHLGIGQSLNSLDKTKRSDLYQFDSLVWCRSVVENLPVDLVSERELYANEPVYLWVRIRGNERDPYSAGKRKNPAFIKLFRVTSYGLTPEITPAERYTPPTEDKKVIKGQAGAMVKMKKLSNENDEFKISLWTGPIRFPRNGSYFIKLIDVESNTIFIKNNSLIRVEVKHKNELRK